MDASTEQNGGFLQVIETARKEGANLLLPTTAIEGLSEWHAPVIERVLLSTKEEDGDVYPDTIKGKLRLTKVALMKLSVCAGIIWSPELCKRLDDRRDRNYIAYQAVGGIRKADGSPVFFKAEYDIDFEVVEEELRDSYQKKIDNGTKNKDDGTPGWAASMSAERREKWVEDNVRRDILQKRKHGLKLAEAGAMNRVVREILGLKNAYTVQQLQKPFVMARIVFKPDYSDKEIRAKLIDASIKQMTGIYGPQVMEQSIRDAKPEDVIEIPANEEEEPNRGNDDTPPGETTYQMNGTKTFAPPEPEPEPEPEADPVASLIADFKICNADSQGKAIEALAKTKKYDLGAFLTKSKRAKAADLREEKRVELFTYLCSYQHNPNYEPGQGKGAQA